MYYYEVLKSRNTGLTYGGTDQNYRQAWNVHDNSLEIDMVQINSHSCVIWGNTWQETTRSVPSTGAGNNIITRITQATLNFSAQHLRSTDQQEKHLQTNSDTLSVIPHTRSSTRLRRGRKPPFLIGIQTGPAWAQPLLSYVIKTYLPVWGNYSTKQFYFKILVQLANLMTWKAKVPNPLSMGVLMCWM